MEFNFRNEAPKNGATSTGVVVDGIRYKYSPKTAGERRSFGTQQTFPEHHEHK
jgi:hypothetical protein